MEYQVTKVITYWVQADSREEALVKVTSGKADSQEEYIEVN